MRKMYLLIPILAVLSLMGCEKEEVKELNEDLNVMQDSISSIIEQHNALPDSISLLIDIMDEEEYDIKAYKMAYISTLFNAMSNQPEASELLIAATEILYTDYTELPPVRQGICKVYYYVKTTS